MIIQYSKKNKNVYSWDPCYKRPIPLRTDHFNQYQVEHTIVRIMRHAFSICAELTDQEVLALYSVQGLDVRSIPFKGKLKI